MEKAPAGFARWNDVVRDVKPAARELARDKTQVVVARHRLPEVFVDTVEWDILHLCMEVEFADVDQPGFYASQAYWYAQGHFPCGWQGTFPKDGKLVIY